MRVLALASVLSLVSYGLLTRPSESPDLPDGAAPAMQDGWTTSVERPAPLDARSVASSPSRRLVGGAFVDVQNQTYAVEGQTEAEILASMRANAKSDGDETFFGLTVAESSFQIQPLQEQGSCVAEQARVEMTVTIILPDWSGADDAPYDLTRDWTRFSTALARHEDGHREIAQRYAQMTHDELVGIRRATCEAVDFEARKRAERIAAKASAEHERYDDQTGHGATQGASWPLR